MDLCINKFLPSLQIFCNMIDIAVINSRILYQSVTGKNISRRKFIVDLIEDILLSMNQQSLCPH